MYILEFDKMADHIHVIWKILLLSSIYSSIKVVALAIGHVYTRV